MKNENGESVKHTTPYRPSFSESSVRWLYSLLLLLLAPLAFIILMIRGAWRVKAPGRRPLERLGLVASPEPDGYLFHCVSVGEVVAASALIKQIMQQEPETPITITTTTATGSARVNAIFGNSVHHFYLPYDLHIIMACMLRRVKPKAVVITEVELWPNMIHACWRRCIPAFVINGRLTDRSARRYNKVSLLFSPMLKKLSHVCAQGERDYRNYLKLGMHTNRLTLTNNIKFDQAASISAGADFMHLASDSRPVLVGGSTHEPEEQVLLDALATIHRKYPNTLLILVPRHPERFEQVARLLETYSFNWCRSAETTTLPAGCQVVLLNEMGKLNEAYQVADFAFVGGSIAQRGGHNALEPAAVAVPVMMGPHTFNNPVICQYLEEHGALTITPTADEIASCCEQWLINPESARQAGASGKAVLQANSGALTATLACIKLGVRRNK